MDVNLDKILTSPFTAGLVGALVGLRFAPGISWGERVTNVAAGAACSAFMAPAASEVFLLTSESMMGFLSFAIGMFGMSVAAAIMEGLREIKVAELINGWFQRK
jgi:hypothetical protein